MNDSRVLLWLDDERDPSDVRWHGSFPVDSPSVEWVRTFRAFVDWIMANGLPDAVCFDHDLGEHESGADAARWLARYCLDHNKRLPVWNVHSANPIGKANITSILQSFERVTEDR